LNTTQDAEFCDLALEQRFGYVVKQQVAVIQPTSNDIVDLSSRQTLDFDIHVTVSADSDMVGLAN